MNHKSMKEKTFGLVNSKTDVFLKGINANSIKNVHDDRCIYIVKKKPASHTVAFTTGSNSLDLH